jgi:hypothetical protein
MRVITISAIFALCLVLASCGGNPQQLELENSTAGLTDDAKATSAASDWVAAWNQNAPAFHFNQISTWNNNATFGSLHSGGIFLIDRVGFTAAMAVSMLKPSLLLPASGSILGIWYDASGDDLE